MCATQLIHNRYNKPTTKSMQLNLDNACLFIFRTNTSRVALVPASQRLEDVANFITYVITHMELGRTSIDRESRASKVG